MSTGESFSSEHKDALAYNFRQLCGTHDKIAELNGRGDDEVVYCALIEWFVIHFRHLYGFFFIREKGSKDKGPTGSAFLTVRPDDIAAFQFVADWLTKDPGGQMPSAVLAEWYEKGNKTVAHFTEERIRLHRGASCDWPLTVIRDELKAWLKKFCDAMGINISEILPPAVATTPLPTNFCMLEKPQTTATSFHVTSTDFDPTRFASELSLTAKTTASTPSDTTGKML